MSMSSSFMNSMYARCNLTCGTLTWSQRYVDVEANLGTTHDELEPRDGQLVDEPTSTTEAGTRIHQVTLWMKSNDTPRKAAGKENPRLQSPSCTDPPGPSH